MTNRIIKFSIWTLFLILSSNLLAQGPPITTETPVMLGLEGSGIRSFGRYISTENSKNYVHVIAVPYNFSSKLQMGAVFPFVFKTPKEMETESGFGDLTVFAKYQLYKKDGKAKTFRVLACIAQTFPTGKTSSEPPIGNDLFQTYFGLVVGQITSKIGVYGDLGYNLTNKNAPDNLVYNFSVGIPLLPPQYPQKQVNAFLEMNGNYQLESEVNQLFLSPGLQWISGRRLLLESSFQLPLFQEENILNKTNFRWLFGIRFLIN